MQLLSSCHLQDPGFSLSSKCTDMPKQKGPMQEVPWHATQASQTSLRTNEGCGLALQAYSGVQGGGVHGAPEP